MTKTILLLAANPKNTPALRLDEEVREIDNGLARAKRRSEFNLKQKWAIRPTDVRRAMLDYEPNIVHFSGHGSGEDGIALEDENGQVKLVNAETLSIFFKLFEKNLECVFLNACYSEAQADAIAKYIPYVIGMKKEVGDKAAIEFSIAFYDALGAGKSIEFAYELACNSIQMAGFSENLTPVLKNKLNKFPKLTTFLQRGKFVFSERGQENIRTVFMIPGKNLCFGMAKRKSYPDVDLTLRLLPIHSRLMSPENWILSEKISKIHGRIKVDDNKLFIYDESLNGIFLRGGTHDGSSGLDSLGERAKIFGTLGEQDLEEQQFLRLPKNKWIMLPDQIDICLGENILRLSLEVFRSKEDGRILFVYIKRLSNYPQHEYIMLVETLMVGGDFPVKLNFFPTQDKIFFEVFFNEGSYWIRGLSDRTIKLNNVFLGTNSEKQLLPDDILDTGTVTLQFTSASDNDFVQADT